MGVPNRLIQPAEKTQLTKGIVPKIRGRNLGMVPVPLLNSRLQSDRSVRIRQIQQLHESKLGARVAACDVANYTRGNHRAEIPFALFQQRRKAIIRDGSRALFRRNFQPISLAFVPLIN